MLALYLAKVGIPKIMVPHYLTKMPMELSLLELF
jgi:hypothetical protein